MGTPRSRRVRSLIVITIPLVLLVPACSDGSSTPAGTAPPQASSPATPPTAGAGPTLDQGTGGKFVFSPSKLTVKQGETVTVSNVGSVPHTFTVTGKGIDVVNNPGQSQQVTIDLPPGTYPFVCRFHVGLGMSGTLIVK